MSRLKNWREVIFEDFSQTIITESTVERARAYKGQVRKPYESKQYEDRRTRILSTPLP